MISSGRAARPDCRKRRSRFSAPFPARWAGAQPVHRHGGRRRLAVGAVDRRPGGGNAGAGPAAAEARRGRKQTSATAKRNEQQPAQSHCFTRRKAKGRSTVAPATPDYSRSGRGRRDFDGNALPARLRCRLPRPPLPLSRLSQRFGLRAHVVRRSAAIDCAAFDRCIDRKHAEYRFGDARLDLLHDFPAAACRAARRRRLALATIRPVTWWASRNGSLSVRVEPVGEIGRGGKSFARRFAACAPTSGSMSRTMPVMAVDRKRQRAERVDRAFLVLLHVLLVGERQALSSP